MDGQVWERKELERKRWHRRLCGMCLLSGVLGLTLLMVLFLWGRPAGRKMPVRDIVHTVSVRARAPRADEDQSLQDTEALSWYGDQEAALADKSWIGEVEGYLYYASPDRREVALLQTKGEILYLFTAPAQKGMAEILGAAKLKCAEGRLSAPVCLYVRGAGYDQMPFGYEPEDAAAEYVVREVLTGMYGAGEEDLFYGLLQEEGTLWIGGEKAQMQGVQVGEEAYQLWQIRSGQIRERVLTCLKAPYTYGDIEAALQIRFEK